MLSSPATMRYGSKGKMGILHEGSGHSIPNNLKAHSLALFSTAAVMVLKPKCCACGYFPTASTIL